MNLLLTQTTIIVIHSFLTTTKIQRDRDDEDYKLERSSLEYKKSKSHVNPTVKVRL